MPHTTGARRPSLLAAVLIGFLAIGTAPAASAEIRVVATIPPVHSLIAGVAAGVSEPYPLVRGGQSPHAYSLSTSDARALHRADLIFAAGESIEGFLVRTATSLPSDTRLVWLSHIEGTTRLEARAGGGWQDHHHGHDHGNGEGRDGHAHGVDEHLWLDPRNAIALTRKAAELFAEADPDHAERYHKNAREQVERLERLERELEAELAAIRGRPYLVFHDAYQYFEHRFDLTAIGSVTIDPEHAPGARRIRELGQRILDEDVICIFAEPQFEPRVIRVVREGTQARTGTLDPLGADLEPGPEAYFELLRNLARDLNDCLAA